MTVTTPQGSGRTVEAKIAALRCYDANPRRISSVQSKALKKSLIADPEMLWARPLIALPDGRVICGNMRLHAATELGWETIPTIFVDLDDVQARTWVLRDNNSYGEWDDTISAFLAELARDGGDLSLTGFGADFLAAMSRKHRLAGRDADQAPPLPAKPKSKPGEIYQLGPHRLLCGDARDREALHAFVREPVDLLWTDPPYGISYTGKTKQKLTIQNDTADGLRALLTAAFAASDPLLAPGARFYIAAPAGPGHLDFLLALNDVGWTLHQTLVWVKDTMVLSHTDHHYKHEPILYGWKPGVGRIGRGNHTGSRWYGDNKQTTVFDVARPTRSVEHPTMKPVALIVAQLENSSRPGDIILDPFAGSGSTLIACEQTGRTCRAIELDPRYCDVIRDRYAAFADDGV